MNVSLTPELEKFIADKVEAGLYQTSSEVVREALRLMKQQDDELRRDVRAGFAAMERGEFSQYDEQSTASLAADIKARGGWRASGAKVPNP